MEPIKKLDHSATKDSIFYPSQTLNIKGQLYQLDRPWIMGILNVTPDSFFDGGRYTQQEVIRNQIQKMITEGADIIDVGAYSTRPGAEHISPKEEIYRLQPALKILSEEFPEIIVSVDTFQAETARASIDLGAHVINDISGASLDKDMITTVAELNVPYILMHIQGTPKDMQLNPQYDKVFKEVSYFFSNQLRKLEDAGVNDIILDPGFGFGKSLEHNYQLLNRLNEFAMFEKPLLVGLSRKSMINKLLGITPDEALNGTSILNTLALSRGAQILRVHDVKEAREAVKIITFTQNLA